MLISWLIAPAHALSCVWGAYEANVNDQVVPENVQIVINHTVTNEEAITYTLEASDGSSVDLTEERAFAFATLTATGPLEPGETYTILQDGEDFGVSFEVGTGLDEEAPAPPTITSAERVSRDNEWGDIIIGARVKISAPAGDSGLAFEYQLSESDDFSEASIFISPDTQTLLGNSACTTTVSGYDPETDYSVRVRSIDLAGNVSAWTDSEPVDTVEATGCSTVGGAPFAAWLALPLLALFRRQRATRA